MFTDSDCIRRRLISLLCMALLKECLILVHFRAINIALLKECAATERELLSCGGLGRLASGYLVGLHESEIENRAEPEGEERPQARPPCIGYTDFS